MSSASAPFFLSAATAVALATNQTNDALVAYPSLHLATGMMPTQFSTLSPPDSPTPPPMFSFQELPSFLSLLPSSPPPLAVAVLFFPLSLPPLVRLYVCRTAPILCFYYFLRSPLAPGGGSKPAGQQLQDEGGRWGRPDRATVHASCRGGASGEAGGSRERDLWMGDDGDGVSA